MFTYLIIDILILSVPLFVYLKYRRDLTHSSNYLISIGVTGFIFIIWDYIATYRGHWDFSPQKTLGINIDTLPIEEIIFFFVVGFSMLFVYDALKLLVEEKSVDLKIAYRLTALIVFLASILYFSNEYTFFVMLMSSFVLFLTIFSSLYSIFLLPG
jgi:lycopene cyclase domain-containing protein